ncbi:MAG: phosphatidate cytidylyltransferase [Dermatophilaceae bacterium]
MTAADRDPAVSSADISEEVFGVGTPVATPGPPPASTSRAGRNLPMAIGVGLLLGLFIVLSLFWHKELFVVVATTAVCIGVWELTRAVGRLGLHPPLVPLVLGTMAMLVVAFVSGSEALLVVFGLTCVAVLLWRGSDAAKGAAGDVASGLFLAAYPGLLAGFSMLLLAPSDGAWREFTFLAVTVASDIGGYAVGVNFGRRPIAPRISPKKSWEGFVGSVLSCMIVGTGCVRFILDGPWWVGPVLGVAVAASGTVGDLAESAIKRDVGIKDASGILPGHGGLMDRLDSLVLTAPVTWMMLAAFVAVR